MFTSATFMWSDGWPQKENVHGGDKTSLSASLGGARVTQSAQSVPLLTASPWYGAAHICLVGVDRSYFRTRRRSFCAMARGFRGLVFLLQEIAVLTTMPTATIDTIRRKQTRSIVVGVVSLRCKSRNRSAMFSRSCIHCIRGLH